MSFRLRMVSIALAVALIAPAFAQDTNTSSPNTPSTQTTTTTTTTTQTTPSQATPSTATQTTPSQTTTQTYATPTTISRPRGLPDYSKPRSHIFNVIAPYQPTHVPPPSFQNAPRIDNLIQNGELRLSLNDAIALALENNLDLAIARYNLEIADTDILLAKAGQGIRGTPTGLVQGTPGGGVLGFGSTGATGGGAGGTTTGAGGVGTGTSGIVTSTTGAGAQVESFDPFLQGTISAEHAVFPESSTVITGTPTFLQNTSTFDFSYNQGWATGTGMSLGFNNTRQATNSFRSFVNPTLNSNFRFTLQQHLLQGFGFGVQKRFIRIAKNNREISDVAFRQQVETTVSQIENIYWDLVNAYEDVQVKQRSLALAQKTLSDNQKQVQIGTLAPIEVVRAESVVATDTQDLIVSQTNLQLQELLTKNALSRSLQGPALMSARVIPTDTTELPENEPVVPVQDLLNQALSHRPELVQARVDLKNRDITRSSAKNALLPSLDAFAFYGAAGLGGPQNPLLTCGNAGAPAPPECLPPGAIGSSGYGSTFGNLFDSSAPDKGLGITLTIPIRNRAAQATQIRSELEYRQAQLRLKQLEDQVTIQVQSAQYQLQQARARVEAATKGRELAVQSLDAEQKKYALGASTNTLVLQAQRDLAQAESNVVTAQTAYEKARVNLDLVTSQILEHYGISIADAETGNVTKVPTVPFVTPRKDVSEPPTLQVPPMVTPQNPPTTNPPATNPPTTTTPPANPPQR
jgi:outer membrane protein